MEHTTFNGARSVCPSCRVLPGSAHKPNCRGGLHDCDGHKYKGYSDGSACYICGNPRTRAIHRIRKTEV